MSSESLSSLRERLRAQHYAHCYCEENVARLLSHRVPEVTDTTLDPILGDAGDRGIGSEATERFAVFVSNASRTVHVFETVWDYHCIVVVRDVGCARVIDLDAPTECRLPLELSAYISAAFPSGAPLHLRPCFRVVPADTFLAKFSSDRRHMRCTNGEWQQKPPSWECFRGPLSASAHTLDKYLDVSDTLPSVDWGRVMEGVEELHKFFSTG